MSRRKKKYVRINTMKIRLPDGSKKLIPKPPIGHPRPKRDRYYNWEEDEDGKPRGKQFEREVPADQYHQRMVVKGDVELADKPKRKAKPAVKPKTKPSAEHKPDTNTQERD